MRLYPVCSSVHELEYLWECHMRFDPLWDVLHVWCLGCVSLILLPSFSLNPYSWEIDHLQTGHDNAVYYLFIINSNTRHSYACSARSKDSNTTHQLIQQFVEREDGLRNEAHTIKGDGDRGFQTPSQSFPGIRSHFQNSQFTYHNKTVDGVMRTLRNALGRNTKTYVTHDTMKSFSS